MMNKEIIEILENIALLLQLKGESVFKSIAYSNAADLLRRENINLTDLVNENKLDELDGFGKALVTKITDYVQNGKMAYYEKLTDEIPLTLLELFKLENLGPKKIKQLFTELEVKSIEDLKNKCEMNGVSKLKGFSTKSENDILASIIKYENDKEPQKITNHFREIR
jgi:DNA polymerase (family 10)